MTQTRTRPFDEVLDEALLKDKEAIRKVFTRNGLTTQGAVANAPRIVGHHFTASDTDIYQIVEELNRVWEGKEKVSYTDEELKMLEEQGEEMLAESGLVGADEEE